MDCSTKPPKVSSTPSLETLPPAHRIGRFEREAPANTDDRANRPFSAFERRSLLQSSVLRIVLCISGRSLTPPACSAWFSRESKGAGSRNRTLATASSSASGSPSNFQQIAATAAAFARVSPKPGDASPVARSTKSLAAGVRTTSSASGMRSGSDIARER
jgi:hypothetical protein